MAAIQFAMAGTQAPRNFGILFALVGVPLIIWNAAGTRRDLDRLEAASNTQGARIEKCMANTGEAVPDTSIRRHVCGCIVSKAAARDAFEENGSYDRKLLEPIIGECLRGD